VDELSVNMIVEANLNLSMEPTSSERIHLYATHPSCAGYPLSAAHRSNDYRITGHSDVPLHPL
jgi:hypothetical protein